MRHATTGIVLLFAFLSTSSFCGESTAHQTSSSRIDVETIDTDALRQLIASSDQPVVMVHVWATWCTPCRAEFPALVKLSKAPWIGKVNVILLSADPSANEEQVREFLSEFDSPWGSRIADSLGDDLFNALSPDWSGALPATFFYGPEGDLLDWWQGGRNETEYRETLRKLLNPVPEGTTVSESTGP